MMSKQHTLHVSGRILDLSRPRLMGILNVTPDSFHTASRVITAEQIRMRLHEMVEQGADIIDVGAMSSRPGARVVEPSEEAVRLAPVFEVLQDFLPRCIFSIDTMHSTIAELAIDHGFSMVNDITAGTYDPAIISVTGAMRGVPFIAVHMQGMPADMQHNPHYDDLPLQVLKFMVERIHTLRGSDVHDVIVDPGFGFGKNSEHNFTLLSKLGVLKILDCPILVGISRKSMIWKSLDITADQALNGTTALHMVALQQGANILRVHDVKEAKEVVDLYLRLVEANGVGDTPGIPLIGS